MVIVINKRTKTPLARFTVSAFAERFVMEMKKLNIETEMQNA